MHQNSNEHELSLIALENRWHNLYQQIIKYEKDIEQSKFNSEIQALTQLRNEYQVWIDSIPSSISNTEVQVSLTRKKNNIN